MRFYVQLSLPPAEFVRRRYLRFTTSKRRPYKALTTRAAKLSDDFDYLPTGYIRCDFSFTRQRDARVHIHEENDAWVIFMREITIACPGITRPVKPDRPKLSLSWRDRRTPDECRTDAKTRPWPLLCEHLSVKYN